MISSTIFGIFTMIIPGIAFLIINQSWKIIIPSINMEYKPWRLFMLICGIPNLICGIAFKFFPESPKFSYSKVGFVV